MKSATPRGGVLPAAGDADDARVLPVPAPVRPSAVAWHLHVAALALAHMLPGMQHSPAAV